ncbi:MAG: DUF2309 domain-containing protein [Bacteroidota bacterium]
MMTAPDELPIRQRLEHWIEHLCHVLPAQAPIRDFVHHNTLHGFQHLPFAEALAAAHRLTGAAVYWPEARFHAAFAAGRVDRDDLRAALDDAGLPSLDDQIVRGLERRDVLLASLLEPAEPPGPERIAWAGREKPAPADDILTLCGELCAAPQSAAADWRSAALARWSELCGRVGEEWTLRRLLEYLSGEDVLEKVRSMLQHHLAAHLDLGVAAWPNPARGQGFFAAWQASAASDLFWEIGSLHDVGDELAGLSASPLDVLVDELSRLMPDESLWPGYLERLVLEMPGWSGMFLWRDRHPAGGDGTRIEMVDYLAVRVLLERLLCADLSRRLTGVALDFDGLKSHFAARPAEFHVRDALRRGELNEALQYRAARLLEPDQHAPPDQAAWEEIAVAIAASQLAASPAGRAHRLSALLRRLAVPAATVADYAVADAAALLAVADSLGELQRGEVWLLAYERHYRQQLFAALAANQSRQASPATPSAQVVMCMDDREEGTRRHLEEIAPDIATYGAAGFFGVPMYWQGIDDAAPSALCPVVVRPDHLVRELSADVAAAAGHAERRERRLRWRERLYQSTRRDPLGGLLLSLLAAGPALLALLAATLAPGWFGESARRWRQRVDGRVATRLALTAESSQPGTPEAPQAGFCEAEQVEYVAAFLRMIGLTDGWAPLVLILSHGSDSRNNPHLSAYDCGACSGKHGGPNARVFAAMANRPAVRAGLVERGLVIPDSTWFVAAEHNTCDDGVEWYDLDAVPPSFQAALDTLVRQLGAACRAHAAERCRRLASAPRRPSPWQAKRHVVGRMHDLAQARPELGHVNNAAALIGRRQMSRGLFLDRRAFLISYDPTADDDGAIIDNILLATGPVGAGIALEYYFSTVDNERFGCGSKVTHNITGLFGVMDGADSDLRTGLPWQMVEIHEPMRLLVVVEQTPAVLGALLQRQAPVRQLVDNGWIVLAAKSPDSAAIELYCPRRGWLRWSGPAVLPQVANSAVWFAGESDALPPAIILGGMADAS